MTSDEFWNQDPEYLSSYLEAYKQKKEEQSQYDNAFAHLQGYYYMLALQQCLQFTTNPKEIYPKNPVQLSSERNISSMNILDKQKEYEEIRKIQLKKQVEQFNKQKNK